MSGFNAEFPGKVEANIVDATTPESARIVQELGFRAHGLVVRSPDGEVLFSQPDHEVVVDEVRARLVELTR